MLKKTFVIIFTIGILFFTSSAAQASTNLSFYPLKISVKEGQTFRVSINVNPKGIKNYTVKSSIKFPADLVSLKTWTYANDWMPIRKNGYDSFDNTKGLLVRTAGYPDGFDKTTNFGSAVFVAKKSGVGVIEFANDNLALGADNDNLYDSGNQLAMTILNLDGTLPAGATSSSSSSVSVKETVPVIASSTTSSSSAPVEEGGTTTEIVNPPTDQKAPDQLFDIAMEIDNYDLVRIEDLGSRVTFMSFGKVPTLVDLTFDILDANGQIVHTEKDYITVETEKVFNKKFSGFTLQPGKYTLR